MNGRKIKRLVRFTRRLETLGVNGLNQVDFINKLTEILKNGEYKYSYRQEQESITVANTVLVADVRQNPNVKNMLRPKDLKQMLEANDMEYVRFNYLGNPFYKKHLKERNFEKAKIEYLNYLKTNENAKKNFRASYTQFRFKKIICLICYCQTNECHRFWLKEALIQAKREFLKIETETEYEESKILVEAEEI